MGISSRLEGRFGLKQPVPFSDDVQRAVNVLIHSLEDVGFTIHNGPGYSARMHYYPITPAHDAPIFAYLELGVRLEVTAKQPSSGPAGAEPLQLFQHSGALIRLKKPDIVDITFHHRTGGDPNPPTSAGIADAVQNLCLQIGTWTKEFQARVRHG